MVTAVENNAVRSRSTSGSTQPSTQPACTGTKKYSIIEAVKNDNEPEMFGEDAQPKQGILAKIGTVMKTLVMFAVFVCMTGFEPSVGRWRTNKKIYAKDDQMPISALLIWHQVVFILIFGGITLSKFGFKGIKEALHWRQLLLFAPQSIFFATSKIPKTLAVFFMAGDIEKCIASFQTVWIAFMFGLTKRHHYSSVQKVLLACITFSVVVYALVGIQEKDADKVLGYKKAYEDKIPFDVYKAKQDAKSKGKSSGDNLILGICFCMCHQICMVLGTFFGELAFKKDKTKAKKEIMNHQQSDKLDTTTDHKMDAGSVKKTPFAQQKLTDAVVSLAWYFFVYLAIFPWFPSTWANGELQDKAMINGGMFKGWAMPASYVAMFILVAKGVVTNLIVKHFDSMAKQVGKDLATLLVFFVTYWWCNADIIDDTKKITALNVIAVVSVATCCFAYGVASMYSKGKQKWRKMYKDTIALQNDLDQTSEDDKIQTEKGAAAKGEKQPLLK